MVARVVTVTFEGVEARRVDVEVQLTGGKMRFVVVGLADKTEARKARAGAPHLRASYGRRPPDRG